MMVASEGRLHLYRIDLRVELVIELNATCTGRDVGVLCNLLEYGGFSVDDAMDQAGEFVRWWNENDIGAMLEYDTDGELRDALKPFDDAGVFFEITDLKWDLG